MTPLHITAPICDAAALPGTWKLAAGRAVTLQPFEAGEFKVAHGSVWATFDGPHSGPANGLGDRVIAVGEHVRLRAGERMVIEPWDGVAYFSWDPLPAPSRRAVFAPVVQPLADLRQAFAIGGDAVARLVAGLASIAWHAVAPRGRNGLGDGVCGRHGITS